MSRLHECLTKGVNKVPSDPHWAGTYATVGDRMDDLYLKAYISNRTGTRTKTKRKTARAQGHEFYQIGGWKARNSGIASVKSQKAKGQASIKKVIAAKKTGDMKT